jgi:hypothetical protein
MPDLPTDDRLFDAAAGDWWRWSGYELGDGGRICPAPSARLQRYNPWQAYRAAQVNGTRPRPYDALLALGELLRHAPAAEQAPAILRWCSRHGLLGLALHETEEVLFPPRWARFQDRRASRLAAAAAPAMIASTRWTRTARGWSAHTSGSLGVPEGLSPEISRALTVEEWSQALDAGVTIPSPRVLEHDESTGTVVERPFSTWERWFIAPPEPPPEWPPSPLSRDFWRSYAEPIAEAVRIATEFAAVVETLFPSHAGSRRRAVSVPSAQLARAREVLEAWLHPVRATVVLPHGGRLSQAWVAPSLLASYAMMVALDVAGGQRALIRCAAATCGRLAWAGTRVKRFCSSRCRLAQEQRDSRRRRRRRRA